MMSMLKTMVSARRRIEREKIRGAARAVADDPDQASVGERSQFGSTSSLENGQSVHHLAESQPRVAVLFHSFGPYHVSRLNAASSYFEVLGVEFSQLDRHYGWEYAKQNERFTRDVIAADIDTVPRAALVKTVGTVLSRLQPDVVAIPGWGHPTAIASLIWCRRFGRPAVIMSDNTEYNIERSAWKERIKRFLVGQFSSALVAGQPQRDYLVGLGMPSDRIFDGFDVVDNDHFRNRADAVRACADAERKRLGLLQPYFLTVSRFVPKKNLIMLLSAYARYWSVSRNAAWPLVLLGDGPMKGEIQAWVDKHGLSGSVHMPGKKSYEDLPAYYALAGALVLPSVNEPWGLVVNEAMSTGLPVLASELCGCAPDLVVPGTNGYTFDPHDPGALAELLGYVASDACDRLALAAAGRTIIANWTPDRFGRNLSNAAMAAIGTYRQPRYRADFVLRAMMLYRSREE